MRISDWSSDVCSSDLVLASMILKPKEEKDTWLVARVKRIYQPLLHKALARKRVVMISALVALLGSFALFPFLGKEFMPQMQEGRSEEHTSELQSLMRISYAVFCLKKKNVIKEHHTA